MDKKNEYTDENTIIELDSEELNDELDETNSSAKVLEEEIVVDLKKEKSPKKTKAKKAKPQKEKKEFFWKRLSKKGKIIVITVGSIILFAIIALILYFFVFKKDNKPKSEDENVVIEKDNYIYENGKLKFLDENDNVIGSYTCKDKDDKKCYVATLSNEDTFDLPKYVDEEGKVLEKRSKIYGGRFVFVYDDKKITLYDIKNQNKSGEYELIKTGDIDENLVVAKKVKGDYGIIKISKTEAKNLLEFDYEYLGIFNSSETFVAKDGTSSYLVNSLGENISEKIRGEIRSFNEDYLAIYMDDSYSLYNYAGEKVLSGSYDYLDFANTYVFAISGIKLYGYDKTLFKLNEAAIKLKSNEYRKTYVFDKDNNLKETKKAYSMTFTENEIQIELAEGSTKTINLNEVKLNKANDFVNYYDGTLYFYADEEKTNLLGTYSCSNKNEVDASSENFTNCFIAKEKTIVNDNAKGYLPIVNNNYVFIKDVKTNGASDVIQLYDIAKSKVKVKYQVVDSGAGSDNITHLQTLNNVVYAQNTSGYYGAITFSTDGPTGLIAFKENDVGTSKIMELDGNIIARRGNTNYLYDRLGKKLATTTFDMIEYQDGYLVVKNGSKYLIYTMPNGNSGSILSNELDYIKLYDKFFIGIKDKKLNVYYYTNGKDKLLTEDIPVKSNSASSYKLEIYTDSYEIKAIESEATSTDYKFNKDWSLITDESE